MPDFNEEQTREQELYIRAVEESYEEEQYKASNSDTEGYDEEGSAYVDSSGLIPNGTAIKAFGAVSLNDDYCQMPTNPNDAIFPSKITLPQGNRHTIARIPYDFRDKNGTAGLKLVTSDHFKFVNPGQNMLDPKLIYYLEVLYQNVAPKLETNQLVINSGFRSPAFERQLCGADSISAHCAGWAVDIGSKGDDRFVIADAAYYIGFGGIACGNAYVHIDINAYGRFTEGGAGFKYISPSQHKG